MRSLSLSKGVALRYAILALATALAAACGSPPQEPEPVEGAAGETGVVVRGLEEGGESEAATPAVAASGPEAEQAKQTFSPYAGKRPTRAYFGDTHLHTANSGDAFTAGNRLSPEQAYRFALGEEIVSSTGVPVRLSRPLDFLVITDHAEGLGIGYRVYEGDPAFASDPTLARWTKMLKEGGQAAADATNELIKASGAGELPPILKDPKVVGPVVKSVWNKYTATAEAFNQPGRFTAMIGYEWSSAPDGNNLHRNVLFRDGKEKADQVLPFSGWQSLDPEKLWEWMANYEAKTGGKLLAIAHNGNISNGRMFELVDFAGQELSKDYAERRARFEVLQEIIQTKGASETHPGLSPNDEFADFGVAGWEYGNLTLTDKPAAAEMRPFSYLRAGLLRGLEQERKLGTNPFKFGFVGSTDAHTTLSAVEEESFMGKHVYQEPSAHRWDHVSKQGFGKTRYTWHYMSAGYAGVWATENTREALWEAMKRREVFGTSGSRIIVRFFGGWAFTAEDARGRDVAAVGYTKGVPMGGDLQAAPADARAPSFLVAAIKDPLSGNLDRIQIVKGWLAHDGKAQEKIYDVAWSDADRRKAGLRGKLAPVGDTVDVSSCTWRNTIGDPDLATVWTDPDFDPSVRAFYYARVIEIPTPRWTCYDALRFSLKMSAEVPMKHQERAWASPIWYTPR